jgi:DNA (cytosine-5)-methyltransferase 1
MNELALFAGAGGGLLGSRLLGWRTACAVEINSYCRSVLLARQRDGYLEPFPIWDDIKTFDGCPWAGAIDVVSGGFPCQDISSAGKGRGLSGDRSGLWFEMLRVIREVRPRFVFAENSPNLRTRGLATVVKGLTELGYDCRWGVLGAWHVGAPHERNRLWIIAKMADAACYRCTEYQDEGRGEGCTDRAVHNKPERPSVSPVLDKHGDLSGGSDTVSRCAPWSGVSEVPRVVNGVADQLDRQKAIGNGQVPAVAALAWRCLTADLDI